MKTQREIPVGPAPADTGLGLIPDGTSSAWVEVQQGTIRWTTAIDGMPDNDTGFIANQGLVLEIDQEDLYRFRCSRVSDAPVRLYAEFTH